MCVVEISFLCHIWSLKRLVRQLPARAKNGKTASRDGLKVIRFLCLSGWCFYLHKRIDEKKPPQWTVEFSVAHNAKSPASLHCGAIILKSAFHQRWPLVVVRVLSVPFCCCPDCTLSFQQKSTSINFYAALVLMAVTVAPLGSTLSRNAAHSVISRRRLSNRSLLKYAASTLSPLVWARAASMTSGG